jgi:peptidoglycan hydrolase-like protein with peptidoglycan-binding domain
MRIVGAVLVALAALSVNLAPAVSKPRSAAHPKPAATAAARAVYAAMPETERMAIQSDLIWTGDYNGMIGADFGNASVAAAKAFQKRNGGKETGILNPDERQKLAESARLKQERAGWRIVEDATTGARLGVPGKLVPQSSQVAGGGRWQSVHGEVKIETFRVAGAGTTLTSVIERLKKDTPSRKADYQVVKPDFFVMSGLQNGVKKFHTRAQIKGDDVRGVTILYDLAVENQLEPVAIAISNAFVGFPPAQGAGATGR